VALVNHSKASEWNRFTAGDYLADQACGVGSVSVCCIGPSGSPDLHALAARLERPRERVDSSIEYGVLLEGISLKRKTG
jgi:hypothetical protein